LNPKLFSAACERNRDPILAILREHLGGHERILEIGSGTGQHAVYFARCFPGIIWQTSDREENLQGIKAWLSEAGLSNTPAPLHLDVRASWPEETYDVVFTANTLHIMSWEEVISFFEGLAGVLKERGVFFVYGPFNENGQYTSASNADFDLSLRSQNPKMGIRDLEKVVALAKAQDLHGMTRYPMPANNQSLVFQKGPTGT
jgi:cyclopropane fatty-acyl-phospholipid synthase-like methyltransferase